jgi:hypothetical protein
MWYSGFSDHNSFALREEEGSLGRIVPYQYKLLEVLLLLLLTKTIPLLTFVASRLPIKTKGSFGSLPVRKWSQHNQTRLRKKKNWSFARRIFLAFSYSVLQYHPTPWAVPIEVHFSTSCFWCRCSDNIFGCGVGFIWLYLAQLYIRDDWWPCLFHRTFCTTVSKFCMSTCTVSSGF